MKVFIFLSRINQFLQILSRECRKKSSVEASGDPCHPRLRVEGARAAGVGRKSAQRVGPRGLLATLLTPGLGDYFATYDR